MNLLIIVVAVFIVVMAVMFFRNAPHARGIEREHRIEQHKIFSSTRTVTAATPDEVIRLLQTDWSWWKRARAETMKDLGEGRKEFYFTRFGTSGSLKFRPYSWCGSNALRVSPMVGSASMRP